MILTLKEPVEPMEIRKLLFVTKFEDLCFDALRSLLNLREADLEHVVFMNVIERDKVAMYRGTGYRKSEEVRLKEKANIRFIDWAEDLFEEGLEVGVYLVVGRLVPQVIKAVEKEEADLLVIGRSPKRVLKQLYGGSDVTELIRRTAVPVLVYKHLTENPKDLEQPFARPLLAMDWSPASQRAVGYLSRLGKVIQQVDVAYVAGDDELTGSTGMTIQKMRKERRRQLDEICDQLEAAGIRAESHVYVGDTNDEIEMAARECQSSMIVLGSSSKSAWVERWLGSTPLRIAEDSAFPTLIIPPEKT